MRRILPALCLLLAAESVRADDFGWLKAPVYWKRGPIISPDANTVAHVYWRNGVLVDAKGNAWAMQGTVPQVAAAGKIPPGAGAFSDANYYLLTSPSALSTLTDFTCHVVAVGTGGTSLRVPLTLGTGFSLLSNSASGPYRLEMYGSGARLANTVTGVSNSGPNVWSFGASGVSRYVKLNLSTTGTGTGSGTPGNATIGRYAPGGGLSYGNGILEIYCSSAAWSEEAVVAAQQSVRARLGRSLVSCIGDSITFGTSVTTPWPYTLGSSLASGTHWVTNEGVGGNTTALILTRWTSTIRSVNPNVVVLLAGVNDALANLDAATIEANLTTLYTQAAADGARVIALTIAPWKGHTSWSTARGAVSDAVNEWIRARTDVIVVDLANSVLNDGTGSLAAAYDSGDHIHPNQAGANLIASMVYLAGQSAGLWSGEQLTVAKAGDGTGTVVSIPAAISCGSTCAMRFAPGSSVTLTATPTSGHSFTGWSGSGCSGTSTCVVTMSEARSVTATFTAPTPPMGGGSDPVTPTEFYTAAVDTCSSMPLRTTGIVYVCDCQTGAETGCAGHEGNDANDGLTPATAKRTWTAAVAAFNALTAGGTVALCRGGAWTTNAAHDLWPGTAPACAAAANMRTADNASTCDLRDYQIAGWGTAKPKITQTGTANLLQFWSGSTDGVRILNLDLQGSGAGPGGAQVGQRAIATGGLTNDYLVCNTTINGWQFGVHLNADNPPASKLDFWGNTITMSGDEGFLGSSTDGKLDANLMDNNGSFSGGTHAIYIGSNGQVAERMQIVNNRILRTRGGTVPACAGSILTAHGKMNNLLIENNVIDGGSSAVGSCFAVQVVGDTGYNQPRQFDDLIIRRNRIDNSGTLLIGISEATRGLVENNILVARNSGTWGIQSPAEAAIGTDHLSTNVTIRHNTLYYPNGSSAGQGITLGTEGTGHVLTGNTIWTVGTAGPCFVTRLAAGAYTHVGNNACNGTWGTTYDATPHVTADPLFTNAAGGDFTLQAGSPLKDAGSATYGATVDFLGAVRASPPSIGAYE